MGDTTKDSELELRIPSRDHTGLYVRQVPSDGQARARLLWVHGFSEHSGRYLETLRWFAGRGIESWILDLRGHGRSGGGRVRIEHFSEYLDDIDSFHSYVFQQRPCEARTFCIGHSMGGLVLSRWLEAGASTTGLEGAVILSPFMGLKMPVPGWKLFASRVLSRLLPHLLLASKFSDEVLSKDPEVRRAYDADPLIPRGATARWFTETTSAQSAAISEALRIELPILVMHGLDDSLADVEATREFFAGIGSEDRELKLWEGLRHELLNEIEKQQVRDHILDWIDRRLA